MTRVTSAADLKRADQLIKQHPELLTKNGPMCGVSTSKDRGLIEAFRARGLNSATISRHIKKLTPVGTPSIGYSAILRHLRGDCACRR